MKTNKSERINLRCTPAEREALEAAAAEMGLRLSEYLIIAGTSLGFVDRQSRQLLTECRPMLVRVIDFDCSEAMRLDTFKGFPGIDTGEMLLNLKQEVEQCENLIKRLDELTT